jgi:hypothetical protein
LLSCFVSQFGVHETIYFEVSVLRPSAIQGSQFLLHGHGLGSRLLGAGRCTTWQRRHWGYLTICHPYRCHLFKYHI